MLGPSGAGKSTLLGLIAAQWFRYQRAQVFAFDRGYSIWMLTAAAGGEFYDLAGPKTNLAFCPLRDIDDDADLAWAVGWIESLCELSGLRVAPRHRNALSDAVMQLAVLANAYSDRVAQTYRTWISAMHCSTSPLPVRSARCWMRKPTPLERPDAQLRDGESASA